MKELPGGVPTPAKNIGTFQGGPPPKETGVHENVGVGQEGQKDTEVGGNRFTDGSQEPGPDDAEPPVVHQTFQEMKSKWS